MKYFAYGSNMSQERLENRIDIIEKSPGYFILEEHVLKFNKIGNNGSGKCNICYTGNSDDKVYGVLYEISCSNIEKLDLLEGYQKGYDKKNIETTNANSTLHDTFTAFTYYVAEKKYIDEELKPYCWYKNHVQHGATVAGLPQPYIDEIMNVKAKSDPDIERRKKELAIYFN
ncbi:MAG: gamma-glutamylcyclotransferase family protein [Gammaproteobacteria bacterium WSBS_2016_MAG_OTU1]